ncbi:MAG: sensor domain-containing diguanylate cyclase [Lactimicrobium sp.]|jgi:diguanylate cyclase (GGDEF)-like protein|uniref:sensor domain-containing diguanylate cyclase n=1 Tax=Lactimicrobium sp. TaxID=2563780 RepID=UPI002F355769
MNKKIRQIQLGELVLFAVIMTALSFVVTGILLKRTSDTLQNYVSNLVAADSRQLQLNIESYLDKVENTVSLLFSDEKYYAFDASDSSLSKYDKIQSEDEIEKEIVRLGLTENFSDFGIVYANDENVGMISEVTNAMFPNGGMYQEFADSITREKTMDGWSFGHQGNVDRLYYAKRLNDHAIAIVSFYGRELETVFELPEQLQDMTIRLVDGNNQILYSSNDSEIGETLDQSISDVIASMDSSATVLSDNTLINSNTCSNGWRVVCTMPLQTLMKDNHALRIRMIWTVAGVAVIMLAAGVLIYLRMGRSMNGMVDDLSDKAAHDLMTDLLNKQTFEDMVSRELSSYTGKQANVFMMMDLDHFKQINDTLGHACGDEVIRQTAVILKAVLPKEYMIGRLGGDEFAAFAAYTDKNKEQVEQEVHALMQALYDAFAREFAHEKGEISFSAGVIVEGPGEYSFDDLYRKADHSLYEAKQSGKGRASYDD